MRTPALVARPGIAPRQLGRQPGGDSRQEAIERFVAVTAILALPAIALVGTYGALLFIVAALVLAALDPLDAARMLVRYSPLLLIPLLAMASTLWSDAPPRTLRAGIQLLLTVIAAIMATRRLQPRQVLLILFTGFLLICVLALPGIPAALANRYALYAPFNSKNQLGFAAHLLFSLAMAVMADRATRGTVRLLAFATVPLAIIIVWLSQSAGAQTSFALTLLIFPALLVFGRIPFGARIAAGALLLALLAVAMVFLQDIQEALDTFRSDVLGKDATLTGRTYLWDVARQISAERPWFGHGYYAFWRHGNVDAEGLWRWAGIASRSGFNFHNAYIEMRVDLGYAGYLLMIASCVAIAGLVAMRQLRRPSIANAFFCAMLAVIYARSSTETGLIAPFSLLTVLWIMAGLYALRASSDEGANAPSDSHFKRTARVDRPRARH